MIGTWDKQKEKMKIELVECLSRLRVAEEKNLLPVELDVYAISNLNDGEDIRKFYSELINSRERVYQKMLTGKKDSTALSLIRKGYNIRDIAEIFVRENLLFALGNLSDDKATSIWYENIPCPSYPLELEKIIYRME